MIPSFGGIESAEGTLDEAFWRRFEGSAPLVLLLGFRASVFLLSAARFGRPREEMLRRWSDSRSYLKRQLVTVLRVVFALAHFSRADVREELH